MEQWKDGDHKQQDMVDEMKTNSTRLRQLQPILNTQIEKLGSVIAHLTDLSKQDITDKERAEALIASLQAKQAEFTEAQNTIVWLFIQDSRLILCVTFLLFLFLFYLQDYSFARTRKLYPHQYAITEAKGKSETKGKGELDWNSP